MTERIVLLFLLALCGAGLLFSWFPDPLVWQSFEMAVYGLAIIWLLAWAAGWVRTASWTWLLLPFSVILALGATQLWRHWTVYAFATQLEMLRWGAYAGVFLLAFQISGNRKTSKVFLTAYAAFGSLLIAESILQYFTGRPKIFWYFTITEPGSGFGPFLNHDHFASFIALVLPVAALQVHRTRGSQWPFVLVLAGLYAAAVASFSRAGFAVITLEIVVLLTMLGSVRKLLAPLLVMIVILAAVVGWGALYDRFLEPDMTAGRMEIDRVSLAIIRSSPWKGTGLGTWTLIYPAFAERDIGQMANAAHNDWLQWTGDGGATLFAMMAALFSGSLVIARRVPWALGIPIVFLHCMIEFPMQGKFFPAMFFLLFGAAARRYTELSSAAPAEALARRPLSSSASATSEAL